MNQSETKQPSQDQESIVHDIHFGDGVNTFTFAPMQIGTKVETQVIQVSAESVMQRRLIKISPYKGLKRFNFADRDRFFGRDILIKRLLKAVDKNSLSLVLGASGSGKSSVVRAGVIPELNSSLSSKKFCDFVFTPNKDPFESFYRCLLSEEKDYKFSETQVQAVFENRSNALSQVLLKLRKQDEHWLIFIDQFEELFTNCTDLNVRQSFIDGITKIVEMQDRAVRIVLAMRSDFVEQLSFYPTLGELLNQNNIHLVTDMYSDELQQAIEQPAAKHGVVFEEGLVEQIIADVRGQSGYLPLLQYTLDLLWESECLKHKDDDTSGLESRILKWSTYNALGGVRGALQKRVDHIYQSLDYEGQILTKQILLRLVNIVNTDSGSRAVSRRAFRSEFIGKSIEEILQIFINENLLVSSYDYINEENLFTDIFSSQKQYATVELAHEILLSSWDSLRYWLEEEREAIILKNWLADETRRWYKVQCEQGEQQAKSELLRGIRLEQVSALRDSSVFNKLGGLSDLENQYIEASIEWRRILERQEKRRKLTAISVLSLFSIVAFGLSLFAWSQANKLAEASAEAIEQKRIAEEQKEEALKQQKIAEAKEAEAIAQRQVAEEQQEIAEIEASIARVQTRFLSQMSYSQNYIVETIKKGGEFDEMWINFQEEGGNIMSYYYTWILFIEYDDPDMNKLTKLMQESCPDAKVAGDCKEWMERLFPQDLKNRLNDG